MYLPRSFCLIIGTEVKVVYFALPCLEDKLQKKKNFRLYNRDKNLKLNK